MTASETERRHFEALLEFLKRQRGFDFTGYKRATLQRRFQKRMEAVDAANYGEYLDYLQVHPDEFTELFNTLLINVTSFFRDKPAWDYLDEQIVPELVRQAGRRGELRIWSAGCASGEETYTIAMLLVRAMGEEAFRDRVKVYATDIDEEALTEARHAAYPPKAVQDIPGDLLERCFEGNDQSYAFRRDLRRSIIFGRNDLVQDAPISRIDLLLCRNTLMYFTAETQSRILTRFNFALRDDGFLFLGKSEMLLTHGDLFRPTELKWRVFSKVVRPGLRDRLAFVGNGEALQAIPETFDPVRDGAFDIGPVATIVVDRAGSLQAANQQARGLFGLAPADVGRPLQDLEVSYRPVELRSALGEAYSERRSLLLGEVSWRRGNGPEMRLDVNIVPLQGEGEEVLGATVTFSDVTQHVALRDELARSKRELEVAYEELQSTVEELETTNEELQSTNEELETTNEELQSTNEELETMNEELQSTNEELETMNDELNERTAELNNVNTSLETILTSLEVGVALVDTDQVVLVWNDQAEDLWGLRSDEAVGQHVFALDIGLPVERLVGVLRDALAGGQPEPALLEATNRRGRTIACKFTAVPLPAEQSAVRGAVLLMQAVSEPAVSERAS